MWNQILGGLAPIDRTTELGIGADPRIVGGKVKARLQKGMQLPTQVSAQAVVKSEQELAKVDAEVEQLKVVAQNQQDAAKKYVQMHEIHVNHSKAMMGMDRQVQSIDAAHGQEVSRYQLGSARTVAYLDAFQKQMEVANGIFDRE